MNSYVNSTVSTSLVIASRDTELDIKQHLLLMRIESRDTMSHLRDGRVRYPGIRKSHLQHAGYDPGIKMVSSQLVTEMPSQDTILFVVYVWCCFSEYRQNLHKNSAATVTVSE